MINPDNNAYARNGYDERAEWYEEARNLVANGASDFPLTIAANSSLISAGSLNPENATQERPVLLDASVLTVLPANVTPQVGDFRPPYAGTDKTISHNVSDIIWGRLPSLTPPNGGVNVPTISFVEGNVERLWVVNIANNNARDIHPQNNQPEYGRDISKNAGQAILRSILNDSQAAKEQLVYDLIQKGIDIHAYVLTGQTYSANGGHNQGYKMPLLFAAHLLDHADMYYYADTANGHRFAEDSQTFYVTQGDIDLCPKYSGDGRTRDCYSSEMLGMPEWGEKHGTAPDDRDGSNWGVYYRDVAGPAMFPHFVAAQVMGVRSHWGHEAFFDYFYRYEAVEDGNGMSGFSYDMFNAHVAANTGVVWVVGSGDCNCVGGFVSGGGGPPPSGADNSFKRGNAKRVRSGGPLRFAF